MMTKNSLISALISTIVLTFFSVAVLGQEATQSTSNVLEKRLDSNVSYCSTDKSSRFGTTPQAYVCCLLLLSCC